MILLKKNIINLNLLKHICKKSIPMFSSQKKERKNKGEKEERKSNEILQKYEK